MKKREISGKLKTLAQDLPFKCPDKTNEYLLQNIATTLRLAEMFSDKCHQC